MPFPSVTYNFSNGSTADADAVDQNFTDIINGISDGTKDISVSAGTFAGNVSISGNTTLGNASSDTITFTGSMASSLPIGTTNSYDIGSSTLGLRACYFGANSQTVNIKGSSSMSATWTFTFPVSAGTVNYKLETDGAGVTSWAKDFFSGLDCRNISLSASVGSSALTITLKGGDGNDLSSTNYGVIVFRNATNATGSWVERKITSNLTLTISSGSTLGHRSATSTNIWVYAIDNAGTVELGASTTLYSTDVVLSSTAEGGAGAADSNRVIYSTTARSNVAMRCIGKMVSSQATAGTWASTMTSISCRTYNTPLFDDPLCMYWYSTTNTTVNNTQPVIPYAVFGYDTHNIWDGTNTATIPVTGKYRVTVGWHFPANNTTSQYILVALKYNGATFLTIAGEPGVGATNTFGGSQGRTFNFTAGDTIQVTLYSDTSTSLGTASERNLIQIDRVG